MLRTINFSWLRSASLSWLVSHEASNHILTKASFLFYGWGLYGSDHRPTPQHEGPGCCFVTPLSPLSPADLLRAQTFHWQSPGDGLKGMETPTSWKDTNMEVNICRHILKSQNACWKIPVFFSPPIYKPLVQYWTGLNIASLLLFNLKTFFDQHCLGLFQFFYSA